MKIEMIRALTSDFEAASHKNEEVEYWEARRLQELLGYSEWRYFLSVIEKAKTACHNAGQEVSDHFVDLTKMIDLGKGAQREIDDTVVTPTAAIWEVPKIKFSRI